MKKYLAMAMCGLALTLTAAVYELSQGFGKTVTATTTAQGITIVEGAAAQSYAMSISLYNAGTVTVFSAINCDANRFNIQTTAGQAVPIPPSMIYTFQHSKIESLWLKTTNGTATVYVGAH